MIPLTFSFEVLGGLGLFILGMKTMSEGIQRIAGERLRTFLEKTSGNRLTAALLGSCMASLLQSGSAASILVVGFVNAGLLSLYQALAVLIGTSVGTTVAIQFIAFKITVLSLPSIFLGVLLRYFCKKLKMVNLGNVLLGMGLVFFGLQLMESGFSPFKQSALLPWFHQKFLSGYISAILAGALLTFLIQSGSAAIAIIIALGGTGLLNYDVAVAMVIGEILGSSLITAIATVGGSIAAKRTVLIYVLINVLAIIVVLLIFPLFLRTVEFFSPGNVEFSNIGTSAFSQILTTDLKPNIARHLANSHTIFSLFTAVMFLPFIGFFARSASSMLPGKGGETEPRTIFIDYRVINTPTIALLQARNEVTRMARVAESMFGDMVNQLHNFNSKTSHRIEEKEEVLDILQRDISGFLITLSQQQLSAEYLVEIPTMLQLVNDLEHLGDQTEAIMSYLRRKKEEKLRFSSSAMHEMKSMGAKVSEIVSMAVKSLDDQEEAFPVSARELLDEIESMQENFHANHIKRLHAGKCSIIAGLLYGDMLSSFTKVAQFSYAIMETERGLSNVTTIRGN